jgi:hypothetical protein
MPTARISSTLRFFRSPLFPAFIFLSAALSLCGCGGGGTSGPKDIVKGKVTLEGKPVSGDVIFQNTSDKSKEHKTVTGNDGTYSFGGLPKGEYTVMVKGMLSGLAASKAEKDPIGGGGAPKGAEPPAKYAKPDNGLPKVDFKGGEMTHNIELTP